jgi:hypothetical protein
MRSFIEKCDAVAKVSGVIVLAFVIISTASPFVGKWVKTISALRFGTHGIVKYELGDPVRVVEGRIIMKGVARTPTEAGNLFLLRQGSREFHNLRTGDVLQADGPQRFRENNGCSKKQETDCTTTSPELFQLQTGQCAVVLAKHQQDSGEDDHKHVNKLGGWVHVATAACGLFD